MMIKFSVWLGTSTCKTIWQGYKSAVYLVEMQWRSQVLTLRGGEKRRHKKAPLIKINKIQILLLLLIIIVTRIYLLCETLKHANDVLGEKNNV